MQFSLDDAKLAEKAIGYERAVHKLTPCHDAVLTTALSKLYSGTLEDVTLTARERLALAECVQAAYNKSHLTLRPYVLSDVQTIIDKLLQQEV